MTKDVDLEGVECQPKEFGSFLLFTGLFIKGQGKRTSIYISWYIHFTWINLPSLNLEGIGVKQLQSLFANHRRA